MYIIEFNLFLYKSFVALRSVNNGSCMLNINRIKTNKKK